MSNYEVSKPLLLVLLPGFPKDVSHSTGSTSLSVLLVPPALLLCVDSNDNVTVDSKVSGTHSGLSVCKQHHHCLAY